MMVLGQSKRVGERCDTPECVEPLERRREAFYWQGSYKDGAYCPSCSKLYAIEGEEIEPLRLARRPVHEREAS